jgi:hypothetical protein
MSNYSSHSTVFQRYLSYNVIELQTKTQMNIEQINAVIASKLRYRLQPHIVRQYTISTTTHLDLRSIVEIVVPNQDMYQVLHEVLSIFHLQSAHHLFIRISHHTNQIFCKGRRTQEIMIVLRIPHMISLIPWVRKHALLEPLALSFAQVFDGTKLLY